MENNNGNNKHKGTSAELTGFHRAVPYILTAVAVFIFICFITGGSGLAGEGLVSILRGLFSFGAYAIPLMMILHAVFYAEDRAKKRIITRIIFSLITVVVVAAIEYTVCFWGKEPVFDPVGSYVEQINGGFIGTLLAFPIVKVIGSIGLIILALAAMALYLAFFFANSDSTFGKFTLALLSAVANVFAAIEKGIKSIFRKIRNAKAEKEKADRKKKSDELLDDDFFDADNSFSEMKIDDLDISVSKPADSIENNPTLQSSVRVRSQVERNSYDDAPAERVIVTDVHISERPAPTPEPAPEPTHVRKKRELNLDYGIEVEAEPASDSGNDKKPANPFETSSPSDSKNRRDAFGIDASADTVFNSDFDPFDFAKAEKAVAKASSKSAARRDSRGIREISAPISDLPTADELEAMKKREAEERERALRLEMFEKRRRDLVERARAEGAIAPAAETPAAEVNEPTVVQTPTVEEAVEPTVSVPTEAPAPVAVSEPVAAEAVEPVSATPASGVSEESKPEAPAIIATPVAAPVATPVAAPTVPVAPAPVAEVEAAVASTLTTSNLEFESEDIKNIVKIVKHQNVPEETIEFITEDTQPASEDTFAKRDGESDEEAALRIAERIAQKNPAYARSANELHTIVTMTEGESVAAASEVASDEPIFSAPDAEDETLADEITFGIDPDEETAAPAADEIAFSADDEEAAPAQTQTADNDNEGVFEFIIDDDSSEDASTFVFDIAAQSDAEPVAPQAPVNQPEEVAAESAFETPAEAPVQAASAVSLPAEDASAEIVVEISDSDSEPITLSEYTTDASATPVNTEFKPYVAPTEEIVAPSAAAAASEVLELERNMLSPTPTSAEQDSDAPTSDEIVWTESAESTETVAAAQTDETEESEGTVFTFDSDGDDSDTEDEEADELEDDETEITESDEDEDDSIFFDDEIPPEEQNPDVIKQRQLFPFLDEEKKESDENTSADDVIVESETIDDIEADVQDTPAEVSLPAVEEEVLDDTPPFEDAKLVGAVASEPVAVVVPAPAPTPAPTPAPAPVKEAPKKPDYSDYVFPPMDLLGLDRETNNDNVQFEIQENADRLVETLSSFNVSASIKGVDRGPRITRYEVVPAKGVKVSSIMNLQDDIALSLAADGIRMEAPIPGKSAVGVEIPNKKSSTVRLRELLETDEFKSMKTKTAVCIGKDVAGQPVINDISKMPHLLIAGATGMGKSVCINSLLISILYKARPDEVKLIMIDPKQVEFTMYNGIPHLLIPVVSDPKQAAGALMWAVDEMERRYNLLNPLCVRNVDAYNEKVARDPSLGEPMSKIIIVIDEFADLMLQVKDPVENLVMRIAQKARAAGIHLIIGTQRPSTNVITGTIKANIPSRISCKVASNVDSRTVLDIVGAEKLLDRGDMLFAYAGAIKPLRVQGAFTSDGEVEAVMQHLKQFGNGDNYDEAVMEEIKRAADKCSKKGSGGGDSDGGDSDSSGEGYLNDRQFLDAVDVAVNAGRLSTALLQRKLSIGYSKAAKFMDVMCDMGLISEPNGQKPREVLITADEWREKLSRSMIDG